MTMAWPASTAKRQRVIEKCCMRLAQATLASRSRGASRMVLSALSPSADQNHRFRRVPASSRGWRCFELTTTSATPGDRAGTPDAVAPTLDEAAQMQAAEARANAGKNVRGSAASQAFSVAHNNADTEDLSEMQAIPATPELAAAMAQAEASVGGGSVAGGEAAQAQSAAMRNAQSGVAANGGAAPASTGAQLAPARYVCFIALLLCHRARPRQH